MGGKFDLLLGKWVEEPVKRKSRAPEKAVGVAVDMFMKSIGAFIRTIKSDGQKRGNRWMPSSQGRGISDRVGLLNSGRFIAIELKAKGKKYTATPEQIEYLRKVIEHGGIGVVADCVEDVKEALVLDKQGLLNKLPTKRENPQRMLEPLF